MGRRERIPVIVSGGVNEKDSIRAGILRETYFVGELQRDFSQSAAPDARCLDTNIQSKI
jgi:hypothetical protein